MSCRVYLPTATFLDWAFDGTFLYNRRVNLDSKSLPSNALKSTFPVAHLATFARLYGGHFFIAFLGAFSYTCYIVLDV
jgi:hypothetical protein